MFIQNYKEPKSSFLSLEKDLSIIVNKILKNKRLQRLLYYTTPDCLERENLGDEEKREIFTKNIKIVPKICVDGSLYNYILVNFDRFVPNAKNPEFRDNIIEFDIICHFNQWHLKDFELRPYKIAGEIDTMLNNQHLTGIGELQFFGANQLVLNDEYAGLCLMYTAIHGEEDKKDMPNPLEQEKFEQDFLESQ